MRESGSSVSDGSEREDEEAKERKRRRKWKFMGFPEEKDLRSETREMRGLSDTGPVYLIHVRVPDAESRLNLQS